MKIIRTPPPEGHSSAPDLQFDCVTNLDKIREYIIGLCEDLMEMEGNFLFKACNIPELATALEEEDCAFAAWERDQVQLDILKQSKPERPIWLYSEPAMPNPKRAYRSLRKDLQAAVERKEEGDIDQVIWEIQQYEKRTYKIAMPGGPFELQRAGRYEELLEMCQSDRDSLPTLLPEQQATDLIRYRQSIFRYKNRYFRPIDEVHGKQVWGKGARALRHLRELGYPPETLVGRLISRQWKFHCCRE